MHSLETWPGGHYLAVQRGAIPDEPVRPAHPETGAASKLPLFPLREIARIVPWHRERGATPKNTPLDWVSLVDLFTCRPTA
jgi:hypothetical protein